MITWILIAFAIAVIFGVIKIDDVKIWYEKFMPKLKKLLADLLSWSKSKTAEIKALAEQKKITSGNKSASSAKEDENSADKDDSQAPKA